MVDRFKQIIRKTNCEIRNKLPLHYQGEASAKVCARICQLKQYNCAKRIAVYHAYKGEIALNQLWQPASAAQGKLFYFPALDQDKKLLFLPTTPTTDFKKNRYGILEPNVDLSEAIRPQDLDLIFMPLVAFDQHGTRIGMGLGYYDRTLSKYQSLLIGVAYDFQYQPFIAAQAWDIPLTAVITPTNTYWCKGF